MPRSTTELEFVCDEKRHLICRPFSIANLHVMARRLRIHPCWFDSNPKHPHYDMPKKRIAQITKQCTVVTSKTLHGIIKKGLT